MRDSQRTNVAANTLDCGIWGVVARTRCAKQARVGPRPLQLLGRRRGMLRYRWTRPVCDTTVLTLSSRPPRAVA
jgi:hypothetical protein